MELGDTCINPKTPTQANQIGLQFTKIYESNTSSLRCSPSPTTYAHTKASQEDNHNSEKMDTHIDLDPIQI
jgi:hypothetical protein